MTKSRFLLLALIFSAAIFVKTLPYILGAWGLTNVREYASFLWNFSPIMALFLFCGAQIPDRRWAFAAPLAAMLVADAMIALFLGEITQGLLPGIPAVYGTYALVVWGGSLIARLQQRLHSRTGESSSWVNATWIGAAALLAGIGGELVFFLTTNFAFWASQTGFYPHSFSGLVECYVMGLPFLKHALPSTLFYSGAFFGGMALVTRFTANDTQASAEINDVKPALLS